MFLVDTDALSTTAPTKNPHLHLQEWFKRRTDDLFISAITIAEIRRGIAVLALKGHSRKAALLKQWEVDFAAAFASRILPVDNRIASRAGDLLGSAEARGHSPGIPDACIAATADLNGLTVLTANVRHFRVFGVSYRLVPNGIVDDP